MFRALLEPSASLRASSVLKGLIVDAGIDGFPRQARSPESQFSVADTVFEVLSWVEHEGMPDHDNI